LSKSVFISHAVKDKELAKLLVNLIEDGIGVPESEIFCSSVDGYGIPTGKNFIEYIKAEMQEPKVVILLLTPSYFNSNFCLCEMGAAWIKSHEIFPILVRPLSYEDVRDILTATELIEIDNLVKYNELRDYIINQINFTAKSSIKWDTARDDFKRSLHPLLENLAIPESPLKIQLENAQVELENVKNENLKLIAQLNAKKQESELLSETEKEMLSMIARGGFEAFYAKSLAFSNGLNLTEVKAQYYLDNLCTKKLIRKKFTKNTDQGYCISDDGRKYAVEHNLVK
jgi:hypothetical protein